MRPEDQALAEAGAELGLALDETQRQRLVAYLDELQRWNSTYNLTAVRDREQMLVQHLFDCLAVLRPLRRWWATTCAPTGLAHPRLEVLDVGSGGGLPGAVLAVMSPDWQVTCIDAVGKKMAFITQLSAALQLGNLRGVHARVEDHRGPPGGYRLITARAFASLADFTRLTAPLLAADGVWVAMKGQHPTEEIAALPEGVRVFHVEPLKVPQLQAQRCLVWMRKAA